MPGLYIHIPFCRKKCFYCDFFSIEYNEQKSSQYVEALSIHCRQYRNKKIDTAYIGGGTPSVLSEKQISKLLESINANFDLSSLTEFTFEVNPESASYDKLAILKQYGVNRLSMGLQSVNDDMLAKIGRIHDFQMFKKSYENARKAGFDNFNLDLIYGLPGQSMSDWEYNLKTVVDLGCEHLSLYPLNVEEDTVFSSSGIKTDDALQREMYEKAVIFLSENGFEHYEISNWAKSGKESVHNSNYWRNFEYIAIGAGASGYENRFRYTNFEDIGKYMERIAKGACVKQENEFIDDKAYETETIILGLRLLNEGVDVEVFKDSARVDTLNKLLQNKSLINDNGRIKLPKDVIFTSNGILSDFVK